MQKWSKLVTKYKEHLKLREKTGESPKNFEFFDDLDVELGVRHDIRPQVVMGSGVGKENVKFNVLKVNPQKSPPKSPKSDIPPKKRKKPESDKSDVMEKLVSSTSAFMDHCKKMDEERNAMFRDFLGIYAKANMKKD